MNASALSFRAAVLLVFAGGHVRAAVPAAAA